MGLDFGDESLAAAIFQELRVGEAGEEGGLRMGLLRGFGEAGEAREATEASECGEEAEERGEADAARSLMI